MRLVIQVPCHDEAGTLAEVLAELPRTVPGVDDVKVLVIDDGSTDGSAALAERCGADRVVRLARRQGLAAAFLVGVETALAMGADLIVNTDGDHQYPGACVPELVAPLLRGEADLVVGDRRPHQEPRNALSKRLIHRLGNALVRRATGLEVHDASSGFRAMSRALALRLHVLSRFSYTLEMLVWAGEDGARYREIPIRTRPPRRSSRLFRSVPEYVFRSALLLARAYVLRAPLRAFGALAVPCLLLGGGLFAWGLSRGGAAPLVGAGVSTAVGAQLLLLGVWGEVQRPSRRLQRELLARVRALESKGRGPGDSAP